MRDLVNSPLNSGQAASIRTRREEVDPDERHAKKWHRQVTLPLEEHIALPAGTVEPIIDDAAASVIARRMEQDKRRRLGDSWRAKGVLSSGLARCAICGSALYIHGMQHGRYFYYTCAQRETSRSLCPDGVRVPVAELDALVWREVCAILLQDGKLESLASQQAQLDADNGPASHLKALRDVKTALEAKSRNLVASIKEASNETTRQLLTVELDRMVGALQEAAQGIADYERIARDQELRRKVVSDLALQIERHRGALEVLELEDATDVPIIRMILDSLGALATVSRDADKRLIVAVDLNLSRTPLSWF